MKKIFISILIATIFLINLSKVEAAGTVSLSTSKSSINIGDTFTISINLSGASVATLTARVSFDSSKVDYVSGPSNSNLSGGRVIYTWTDPTGGASPLTGGTIATFTFKAKAEGNASFSVSGNFFSPEETSVNPSFSGTSVSIKKVETTTPGGNTGTGTGTSTGIGGESSGGANSSGSGGGSSSGETGGTGSSGNSGTITTPPTTNPPVNNNNSGTGNNTNQQNQKSNLKSLQINVEGISPNFNKNTTVYYVTISENISNINVTAVPEDSKASVQISGNTNIQIGNSQTKILVTAENGNKKEYIINLTKTNNPELANASLENLAIENVTLVPEFNADITDYTAEIWEDMEKLNILAVPQIEAANVIIEGNENLQVGDNYIKITVLAQDGQTSKVYNIAVKKNILEEENGIIQNNLEGTNINNEKIDNNIKKKVENDNVVLFIGIIGLIIFIIIIIVSVKKIKK